MKNIRHILSILTTNRIYAPSRRIVNLMQEKTTRRVLWYQRGNQNPYIEEEQTKQWPTEKLQKDKQRSTKLTHKTKDRVTRTPLKPGDELSCSIRVGTYCSNSYKPGNKSWMRKGPKCLRQVEHIRGHLWHRYSITVNQVMMATIKCSKWWLQLYQKEPLVQ
jgi:hypothetical protein